MTVIYPQSRADWFKDYGVEVVRKNIGSGWDEHHKPKPGVNVCVVGFYNEAYDPIAEIAEENWAAYCDRHGYCLRTYPGAFHLDASQPETYGDKGRFQLYYDVRGIFDVVMMLDMDSLFVDMDYPGPHMLGRRFLWTYGESGPMSGLLIARTDDKTEKHLRFAYEYAAVNNNVRHGKIEPNGISDQDAMTYLMRKPPFDQTFGNCIDAEDIGFCFPDTKNRRPWIITCKGGSLESKLQTLHTWSQKIASRS